MDDELFDRAIRYRKLEKYKYKLMVPFCTDLELQPAGVVDTPYIRLSRDGVLRISASYAWDGPSGPAVDTRTFMRASLVHDALYQLMRGKYLDFRRDRHFADDLLKKMCLEDGMFPLRAWYIHKALRLFGRRSARPHDSTACKVFDAP